MTAKLFILGRPGSGKSTAARRIAVRANIQKFSTVHVSDYPILSSMAQNDTNHQQFRLFGNAKGFDVLDFSVMDVALAKLETQASRYIRRAELIIIEFARDDYRKALDQLSSQFIQNAYFLYIDADADICVNRIRRRIAHPVTIDDHDVSDTIVKGYYGRDNRAFMVSGIKPEYKVPPERLWIIDNMESQKDFERKIDRVTEKLLRLKTRILPETARA